MKPLAALYAEVRFPMTIRVSTAGRLSLFIGALLLASLVNTRARAESLWDMRHLEKTPAAEWGERKGLIQEVLYEGETWKGKRTRTFAYYAHPEGRGPFPGIVLVHGGGGTAFPEWALHWARRGYAAIAMDLTGHYPKGQLPDGGPDPNDSTFRPFVETEARDMWTYHAVAAAIRANSLLAARPEVDRNRIAVTGISWGGYLTCIIAGVDHRFKAAVPVYGCGFLHENSAWKESTLGKMDPELRERWVRLFDPSRYLGGIKCPILFLNGTNDHAYPTDSHKKSFAMVHAPKILSLQIRLPHGHIWTFGIVDAFIDSILAGGAPLVKLGPLRMRGGTAEAAIIVRSKAANPAMPTKAELYYATAVGPWQLREWKIGPARIDGGRAIADLPANGPLVFCLAVTDIKGNIVTTPYEILSQTP